MEDKEPKYANGFSFVLSKDGGEAIIAFTQNQPKYNSGTGKFEDSKGKEVITMIMPYKLAHGFCDSLKNALEKEENKKQGPVV